MIEFRKLGKKRGGRGEEGESLNFSQVKFKDRSGRKGDLRWKTKKDLCASNETISSLYVQNWAPTLRS